MADQPKTLTESEVLGAIDSLEGMVQAAGGDVEAKATLALTTYRVAARTKGLIWADQRFGPIFGRLRDQAQAAGRRDAVEKVFRGIPDVQRMQRASEAAAHDVEALAVLVREMAAAGEPPPLTDDEIAAAEAYFAGLVDKQPVSRAQAQRAARAFAELRRRRRLRK